MQFSSLFLSISLLLAVPTHQAEQSNLHFELKSSPFKTMGQLLENPNVDILNAKTFSNGISLVEYIDYTNENTAQLMNHTFVNQEDQLSHFLLTPNNQFAGEQIDAFVAASFLKIETAGKQLQKLDQSRADENHCDTVVDIQPAPSSGGDNCFWGIATTACANGTHCTTTVKICFTPGGTMSVCNAEATCYTPGVGLRLCLKGGCMGEVPELHIVNCGIPFLDPAVPMHFPLNPDDPEGNPLHPLWFDPVLNSFPAVELQLLNCKTTCHTSGSGSAAAAQIQFRTSLFKLPSKQIKEAKNYFAQLGKNSHSKNG